MNAIINITQNVVGNKTIKTVNARALHEFLGIGRGFSDWIKERIEKYEFIISIDYILTEHKTGIRQNVTKKDYHISLSMAKELAMVENNAQGKEARKYFIACEARLNDTPKGIVLDNPMQLRAALLAYTETVIALEASVLSLTNDVVKKDEVIEKQLPAVEFVRMFVERGLNTCLSDAFKGLGLKPTIFIKRLTQDGVLFKRQGGSVNHAKQAHINAGHFVERFSEYSTQTLITPKGVLWLTKNYKAYMEEHSK
jgi:anti-repressor protein